MTKSERFLAVYSGLLTVGLMALFLTGATTSGKRTFEEIDVQQINLREADGTLRLVLANNARAPEMILRGTEYPHPRSGKRGAGMWFFNDEGTETGGLTFAGATGADGSTSSRGSLAFDQYEQDQVVKISHSEHDGKRMSGLTVQDRPQQPLSELMKEFAQAQALSDPGREQAMARLAEKYPAPTRVFVGRDPDRNALLSLQDADNRPRIVLRVSAEGQAAIEFFGDDGKVAHRLTPETGDARR